MDCIFNNGLCELYSQKEFSGATTMTSTPCGRNTDKNLSQSVNNEYIYTLRTHDDVMVISETDMKLPPPEPQNHEYIYSLTTCGYVVVTSEPYMDPPPQSSCVDDNEYPLNEDVTHCSIMNKTHMVDTYSMPVFDQICISNHRNHHYNYNHSILSGNALHCNHVIHFDKVCCMVHQFKLKENGEHRNVKERILKVFNLGDKYCYYKIRHRKEKEKEKKREKDVGCHRETCLH